MSARIRELKGSSFEERGGSGGGLGRGGVGQGRGRVEDKSFVALRNMVCMHWNRHVPSSNNPCTFKHECKKKVGSDGSLASPSVDIECS